MIIVNQHILSPVRGGSLQAFPLFGAGRKVMLTC
jgi:hypothetical protein